MSTNRNHKDRLIRYIFRDKKNLLSLYNAINHSSYTKEEDLEIYTMEDYVYMGMKNDISFLIDWCLNLYEHQSTVNPNMPLRGFLYIAGAYKKYITQNGLDLYSSAQLKIPIPQYYILYNGEDNLPDESILKLTDSMPLEHAEELSSAQFTALVLNINQGHNQKLLEDCQILGEYASFIAQIRQFQKSGMSMTKAIDAAASYCINNNILKEILQKNKSEVTDMLLTEYDEKYHIKCEKKLSYNEGHKFGLSEGRELGLSEGRELGLSEGRELGLSEGRELALHQTVTNLYAMGMDPENISRAVKLNLSLIMKWINE